MKILLFFPFLSALVLVSAVPARHPPARPPRLLLEEMVITLNRIEKRPTDVGHTLIADVIDVHNCKREDFCRVEKVLSNMVKEFKEKGIIVRQLKEYNKDFKVNCPVVENKEIELKKLLHHLRICAQKKYAQ
ncbi:hypothetical protein SKAU_G00267070 [Synaphobranchus kaupii]|uniref:Uncharacterized protein n=1 Tax=Synaphobranchus kaupii TaxID=118154 RepID=A0A9Q1IN50_SYNKA|nr:hypothetical protein SKAU_G00267070 [Synaphobranchus kaupii]